MKNRALLLLTLVSLLGLQACLDTSQTKLPSFDYKSAPLIPEGSSSIPLYKTSGVEDSDSNMDLPVKLKGSLPENFLVQSALELNLDHDSNLEQLVIYKTSTTADDVLHLGILDYDERFDTYSLVWTSPVLAVNNRTFSARPLDLTADGIPELLASGPDANGKQCLDVFYLDSDPGTPPHFNRILSISADIAIDVRKRESEDTSDNDLPDKFVLDQYYISMQNKDPSNNVDILETQMEWKDVPHAFITLSTKHIPGQVRLEEQLNELINADLAGYEAFLNGAWYRTLSSRKAKEASTQILFFDPSTRSFRLLEGDRMESYTWKSSNKLNLAGRLQIYLENESFHTVTAATVILQSPGELSFFLQDKNEWTGGFQRLSADQEQHLLQDKNKTTLNINTLVLNGLFRTDSGGEIIFAAPTFTWRQGDTQKKGGYLTYQLGSDTVLEMQSLTEKGLIIDKEYYIISQVKQSPDQIGLYELTPALPNIMGAQGNKKGSFRIQQIEQSTN